MSGSKPHIVLIPGAWHSGNAFDLLVPLLTAENYSVTALTLPSVGAEPPLTSVDPDIQHVRECVVSLLDQGQAVVVVMHSFAGIVGSSSLSGLSRSDRASQGLPGGVVALVYLCAWMTPPGQSIQSSGGGRGGKGGLSTMEVDGDYIRHLDPVPAFYNDLLEGQAKQYAARLTHHSFPALKASLTYPAYEHIPATYLLCTNDNSIPYERQLKLVDDAGSSIKTFTCSAGHSPFLSQPELTARVIRHASGESIEV